ncbi:hypothetical protein [Aquimarina pacifica]|uniref:hypothetical protein n=1 Tax=Aquimarina pacifica TaxID=1296415 RepID=UPI000470E7B6|nr:hypothetical protein [Aquimarina pacifica]
MKKIIFYFILLVVGYAGMAQQTQYNVTAGNGNGLRFWNSDSYKIHMGKGTQYAFGPVTDYSIKSNMNTTTGRGWTWGTLNQVPVAGLSNVGDMRIAGDFTSGRMNLYNDDEGGVTGYIEADTQGLYLRSIGDEMTLRSGNNMNLYASELGVYADIQFFNGQDFNINSSDYTTFRGGGSFNIIDADEINVSTGNDVAINAGQGVNIQSENFSVQADSYFSGNIGVGTISPQAKLNIVNPTTIGLSDLSKASLLIGTSSVGIGLDPNELVVLGTDLHFGTISSHDVKFLANKSTRMFIESTNGNVGIGTTTPQNKLSVNGTIWAKEVKVSLTDAADWVFEEDYNLRPLEEVANYIKENKHLPEMPSADEFRQNDMKVSEMTNKLLQKIEELTLYTIEQEKQLTAQNTQLQAQDKKLAEMEALKLRMAKLEALLGN